MKKPWLGSLREVREHWMEANEQKWRGWDILELGGKSTHTYTNVDCEEVGGAGDVSMWFHHMTLCSESSS